MFFGLLTTSDGNIGSILDAFLGLIDAIKNGTLFQPNETTAPPEQVQAVTDILSGTGDFVSDLSGLCENTFNFFKPFLNDTAISVVGFTIGLWALLLLGRIFSSLVKVISGGIV